ncbi:MAG: phospholipase A [Pseudomonadota bacterium]|nr:phospholipase A [Pseudomonadota bacterium]
MRRVALLLLALVALAAEAAPAQWIIASPESRAVAGESFELVVVAPQGETPPDELAVRMKVDVAELVVRLRAVGRAAEGRRTYAGTMPASASGQVTMQLLDQPSNVLVVLSSRRDAMQSLITPGMEREPPLSENDPMYFIVGTRGGNTARFQLSFKYRLFDASSGFGQDQPWLSGLFFGYTQNALWDLSSDSKAFRDTNYRPQLFWRWQRTDNRAWLDGARLGIEHESNGSLSARSRSIDILFLRPEWRWQLRNGHSVEFTPKIYGYLEKEENPDIPQYRGYVDWRARYDASGEWLATGVLRVGTAGKASMLLDLSKRVRDLRFGPVGGFVHIQFFAGYGEDIVDYNLRRKSQLRFGFAIVP